MWRKRKKEQEREIEKAEPSKKRRVWSVSDEKWMGSKLRREEKVLTVARDIFKQEKPVAAICHAAWSLISSDVV